MEKIYSNLYKIMKWELFAPLIIIVGVVCPLGIFRGCLSPLVLTSRGLQLDFGIIGTENCKNCLIFKTQGANDPLMKVISEKFAIFLLISFP